MTHREIKDYYMRLETSVPVLYKELHKQRKVKMINNIQWARSVGCRSDCKPIPTVQPGNYVTYSYRATK